MNEHDLRNAVRWVALLNLAYFGLEFLVALRINSVSLLADSVDFLEDAAVNLLIFSALGWSAQKRAKLGAALSGLLLLPAIAFLWTLYRKFGVPVVPGPVPLGLTGMGALAVNLFCAFTLARYRHHSGSLTKAAFLSARNDAIANIAIIVAGAVTLFWRAVWPDIIVGLGIALMNLGAAREVWQAARGEQQAASL